MDTSGRKPDPSFLIGVSRFLLLILLFAAAAGLPARAAARRGRDQDLRARGRPGGGLPSVGGSFAAAWARMVLKKCSSERRRRETRF